MSLHLVLLYLAASHAAMKHGGPKHLGLSSSEHDDAASRPGNLFFFALFRRVSSVCLGQMQRAFQPPEFLFLFFFFGLLLCSTLSSGIFVHSVAS